MTTNTKPKSTTSKVIAKKSGPGHERMKAQLGPKKTEALRQQVVADQQKARSDVQAATTAVSEPAEKDKPSKKADTRKITWLADKNPHAAGSRRAGDGPGDVMRQALVMVLALISIFTNAGATETNIRTYVLYGQGGPLMSRGMEALAASLEKMDKRLHVSRECRVLVRRSCSTSPRPQARFPAGCCRADGQSRPLMSKAWASLKYHSSTSATR